MSSFDTGIHRPQQVPGSSIKRAFPDVLRTKKKVSEGKGINTSVQSKHPLRQLIGSPNFGGRPGPGFGDKADMCMLCHFH